MIAAHLNPKLFDPHVEQVPTRNGYGEALLALGEADPRIVALCADLTESTRTNQFAEAFPERFIEIGIAEQNMASVASGMAAMGKIPFIASYAMFSPGRNWEQIRTTVAYNDANVKIIGAHAGLSVGPDGATHQALEDIALMRVLPNMIVLVPCDVNETKRAVAAAVEHDGPVYIRVAREKSPVITSDNSPFAIGKAEVFMNPTDDLVPRVGIVSCGPIIYEALHAARELNESGMGTTVLNLPSVKPLDTEALSALATEHELIVTVEEHQIVGGLGSAVAEYLSESEPRRVVRIGVRDEFGESGTVEELYRRHGLDAASIVSLISRSI